TSAMTASSASVDSRKIHSSPLFNMFIFLVLRFFFLHQYSGCYTHCTCRATDARRHGCVTGHCLTVIFSIIYGDHEDCRSRHRPPGAGNTPPVVVVSDTDVPSARPSRSSWQPILYLRFAGSDPESSLFVSRSDDLCPHRATVHPLRSPANRRLFHQLVVRRPADALQGGGSDLPSGTPQGVLDHLPLHTFPFLPAVPAALAERERRRYVEELEDLAGFQPHDAPPDGPHPAPP